MTKPVYIVSAARTPIGKFGGAMTEFTAASMGVMAVRAAVQRAFGTAPAQREPGEIGQAFSLSRDDSAGNSHFADQLIFGNARPAGVGPNLARQIAWRSGLGDDVPAFTVNMACGSGLRSVVLGWQQILLGECGIVIAGGAESMSRAPYLLDSRWGFKMGHQQLIDSMSRDGFFCPMSQMVMGETVEVLAQHYQISRDEQEAYALRSHQRAAAALASGKFQQEIVPVERKDKKGNVTQFVTDEHVRPDVTAQSLAKLPPAFPGVNGNGGTITAGTASGLTDAAAALLLAGEDAVRERKLTPLARIVDATIVAIEPRYMGVAPVKAIRKLAKRTGWNLADYDAIELNEAFAAQVLACDREMPLPMDKVNPNGGAIALGHPIGCTGARILTTLLHHLRAIGGKRGLATLCVSGGLGVAMAIEM